LLNRLDGDGIMFLHKFYMLDEKFQLYMRGRCLGYVYMSCIYWYGWWWALKASYYTCYV